MLVEPLNPEFQELIIACAFRAISYNEVSNNEELIYRFSDADGYRRNRSGLTFGRSQYDLHTNPHQAGTILSEIGFTLKEIDQLKKQSITIAEVRELSKKLQTDRARAIIDKHDKSHIVDTFKHVQRLMRGFNNSQKFDLAGFVAVMDFHNQISARIGGGMNGVLVNDLKAGGYCLHKTVIDYKMRILWGRKRPDDVKRRANGVERGVAEVLANEDTYVSIGRKPTTTQRDEVLASMSDHDLMEAAMKRFNKLENK